MIKTSKDFNKLLIKDNKHNVKVTHKFEFVNGEKLIKLGKPDLSIKSLLRLRNGSTTFPIYS